MKRLTFIIGAAAALCFAGCKTTPTADVISLAAKGIGGATGLILNECKISEGARNATVDIVNRVSQCVPEVGQTIEEAWTPIAQAHTDKLIADGKIDSAEGLVIMTAFKLVVRGFSLIEIRYPAIRTYRDLTNAAIDGFATGFLDTFHPVNLAVRPIDIEAYNVLKAEGFKVRAASSRARVKAAKCGCDGVCPCK